MSAFLAILPDILVPVSLVALSAALFAYAGTLSDFRADAERDRMMARMALTPPPVRVQRITFRRFRVIDGGKS